MLDNGKDTWVEFDFYRLHRRRRVLERDGERVRLTPRVFDLLVLLVDRAGEVVTKEDLLDKVWADAVVEEGNINRTVSTLRKHLGKQVDGADFIETVPRVGYRFLADVVCKDTSVPVEAAESANVVAVAEAAAVSATSSRRRLFGLVVGLLMIAFLASFVWKYWPTASANPAIITKNTMVRLLDTPEEEMSPTFSIDGRIRFGRRFADKSVRWFSMALDGTDVQPESDIANLSFGKWSPDGSKVVFGKIGENRKLYVANADGSGERPIPYFGGNAVWSPDSKSYLYQEKPVASEFPNNAEIQLYSFDTGISTRVVDGPTFDGDPAFSPDGGSIAFVSDRDGNFEIYLLDLATRETRRLTNDPAHDSFPSFSPDGTQILFNSDREKENSDVYLMNVDGSGVRKLTDGPGWEAAPPDCWSPDGTKILLLSDQGGNADIYVIEVEPYEPNKIIDEDLTGPSFPSYSPDGMSIVYQTHVGLDSEIRLYDVMSNKSRLLTKTGGQEVYPSFSPDGKSVLFQEKIDDNTEVCLIGIDGEGRTNLTQNHAKDMQGAFSPDGKSIVFSTNRGDSLSLHAIYVMNPDGSNQHQVFGDKAMSVSPTFSRDGSVIFFSNDREGGRIGNFEIFSISAAGGPERRLTNRRRSDSHPAISPDGKKMAFSSNTDGNPEIYMMNIDGSGLLRLTRDLADDNSPRWSPDGRHIIFSSDRGGKTSVYRIDL